MKTIAIILALAAFTGCSAFTSPHNPVTHIRQDVPSSWRSTPDPLDTPAVKSVEPEANGHFGPFGNAPLSHRNFNGSP
jgi:hypothetical protein